jgi:hypothetical protein
MRRVSHKPPSACPALRGVRGARVFRLRHGPEPGPTCARSAHCTSVARAVEMLVPSRMQVPAPAIASVAKEPLGRACPAGKPIVDTPPTLTAELCVVALAIDAHLARSRLRAAGRGGRLSCGSTEPRHQHPVPAVELRREGRLSSGSSERVRVAALSGRRGRARRAGRVSSPACWPPRPACLRRATARRVSVSLKICRTVVGSTVRADSGGRVRRSSLMRIRPVASRVT